MLKDAICIKGQYSDLYASNKGKFERPTPLQRSAQTPLLRTVSLFYSRCLYIDYEPVTGDVVSRSVEQFSQIDLYKSLRGQLYA